MLEALNRFCDKHNIRKAESIYLFSMHVLCLIGLIHLCFNTQYLMRVLSDLSQFLVVEVTFHCLYALGITGGSHRLWAHKSYSASTPLKVLLMLLNAGTGLSDCRRQPRFYLPLVAGPPPAPQVLRHRIRSPHHATRFLLRSCGMVTGEEVRQDDRGGQEDQPG